MVQLVVWREIGPALCGVVSVVSGGDDGDGAAERGHGEVGGRRARKQWWVGVTVSGPCIRPLGPLMLVLTLPRIPLWREINQISALELRTFIRN